MQYVVGFIFSPDFSNVLLIRKNRPKWQQDMLNGVGGKMEPGETPHAAMARETEEEAGLVIPESAWELYAIIDGGTKNYTLNVLTTVCTEWETFESLTDEKIEPILVDSLLSRRDLISNLRWLIPLSMDRDVSKPIVFLDEGVN